jgi:hypothetical protein
MNVFEHFSCHTILPVKLEDIKEHILETGVVESIDIIPADLDPQIVAGFLRVFKWKGVYAPDAHAHAEVFYSKQLDIPSRRLVICKEMLHILDEHKQTAQTRAIVERLIVEVSAPPSMTLGLPAQSDHMGVWLALSVLVPRDALEYLRAVHQAGMSAEAIAKLAVVPSSYMETLLSPLWQSIIERAVT